jgi:outer membrane protein TolC
MMKFSLALIFLLFWSVQTESLTIREALKLSLENNHRIKEFQNLSEAQRNRVDSERAAFWPKVDLSYRYERNENTFFFQTNDASIFTAEITYNLFNGFTDISTLKATQSELDASRHEQKAVEADIMLETKKAYIEVLRARQRLGVADEAVRLLERQRHDAELFFRSGLTAKNDLLKVEVELASARQDLLLAESNLLVTRKALERMIGVPIKGEEAIEDIDYSREPDIEEEALFQEMFERRSELKFLKSQKQSREYTRDSIKGEYYPSIDFSFIHSQFGETFAFEGRDDPLFDSDSRAVITAQWNLFDGFKRKNDIRSEASEILAITERIRDTEDDLRLQLMRAIEGYRVSSGRLKVAQTAIDQAQENYRITENQFRQRIATTTDLLDARFLLTRAQLEYTNALSVMYLSIAAIERVVEKRIL